jgi:hypothetical protein
MLDASAFERAGEPAYRAGGRRGGEQGRMAKKPLLHRSFDQ